MHTAPNTEKINSRKRSWLLQLYREHRQISLLHRVKLTTPIIEISDAVSSWGSWQQATSTIRIASRLIETHTWDVVINVLKHEMAHQAVSEVFRSREGHGGLFDQACDMLGVPADFRTSGGDLPRVLPSIYEKAEKTPEHALLAKIEKILALARSSNEHEALLAMEKANQLITKYNVARLATETDSGYDCIIINHRKKRIETHQRKICAILSRHFFVRIVLADLFDAEKCASHKTIEIIGARENVLTAEYVYYFLLSRMASSWREFRRANNTAGRRKRSYCLGLLDGFAAKLAAGEQKRADTPVPAAGESISALICDADHGLNLFIRQRHPRLARRSHRAANVFSQEYEAGQRDGRKLVLHKGVENHDGNRGKMLPQG